MSKGNESAFPRHEPVIAKKIGSGLTENEYIEITRGLTKREYFAAMAMQGILNNSDMVSNKDENSLTWASDAAIKFADALLNHLSQNKK